MNLYLLAGKGFLQLSFLTSLTSAAVAPPAVACSFLSLERCLSGDLFERDSVSAVPSSSPSSSSSSFKVLEVLPDDLNFLTFLSRSRSVLRHPDVQLSSLSPPSSLVSWSLEREYSDWLEYACSFAFNSLKELFEFKVWNAFLTTSSSDPDARESCGDMKGFSLLETGVLRGVLLGVRREVREEETVWPAPAGGVLRPFCCRLESIFIFPQVTEESLIDFLDDVTGTDDCADES